MGEVEGSQAERRVEKPLTTFFAIISEHKAAGFNVRIIEADEAIGAIEKAKA